MTTRWKYTETRPSTDIPFFDYDEIFMKYMTERYVQHIKYTFDVWEYSEDGLSRTSTPEWADDEQAKAFDNDDMVAVKGIEKDEYCEKHGIIRTRVVL